MKSNTNRNMRFCALAIARARKANRKRFQALEEPKTQDESEHYAFLKRICAYPHKRKSIYGTHIIHTPQPLLTWGTD